MNRTVLDSIPLLAECSRLAYMRPGVARRLAENKGLCEFRALNNQVTHIEGFVAASHSAVVVAFRGTDSLRNWLTDARIRMVKVGKVRVHIGFWNALQSVTDQIRACIDALGGLKGRTLYVTGHSLGGALALLYAWQEQPINAVVVTFGQPRVGNAAFARAYDRLLGEVTLRVVHQCDIVPRVPIFSFMRFYRHTKNNLFIDALNVSHLNMNEWLRLPSDVMDVFRGGLHQGLKDHGIELYTK